MKTKLIPRCQNNAGNTFGNLKKGYHIERGINGEYIQVPNSRVGTEHGTVVSSSGTIQSNSGKKDAQKNHANRARAVQEVRKEIAEEKAEQAVANRARENSRGQNAYTKTIDQDQQEANDRAGVGNGHDQVVNIVEAPLKTFTDYGQHLLPGVGFGKALSEYLHGETDKATESAKASVVPTVLGITGAGAGMEGLVGLASRGVNLGASTKFAYDAGKDIYNNGLNFANASYLGLSAIPLFGVGRRAYNNAKYTYGRLKEDPGAWYAPFEYGIAHSDPGKRALELAMKADGGGVTANGLFQLYDPRVEIKNLQAAGLSPETIRSIVTYPALRNDLRALNYIFTGNKKALKHLTQYKGASGSANDDTVDMIRAYLYGENPGGLRQTRGNFGMHANYVKTEKPNTQYVYHTDAYYPGFGKDLPISQNVTPYIKASNPSPSATFPTNGKGNIDVAGHMAEFGIDENGYLAVRGQDAWRFNPKAYKARYYTQEINNANNKLKGLDKNGKPTRVIDFGLHTVDEASMGSVPITRTNWSFANPSILEYSDVFDKIQANPELKKAFLKNLELTSPSTNKVQIPSEKIQIPLDKFVLEGDQFSVKDFKPLIKTWEILD